MTQYTYKPFGEDGQANSPPGSYVARVVITGFPKLAIMVRNYVANWLSEFQELNKCSNYGSCLASQVTDSVYNMKLQSTLSQFFVCCYNS